MDFIKLGYYQNKIWEYGRKKRYYQDLISGYNAEKDLLYRAIDRLNNTRRKLEQMSDQLNQCHQMSSIRVGNTAGLQNINKNLVRKLTTGMNEVINGKQYQRAVLGINNQYSEIDAKKQNKQSKINYLDGAIWQHNNDIRYCDDKIAYYQKKIDKLKAADK